MNEKSHKGQTHLEMIRRARAIHLTQQHYLRNIFCENVGLYFVSILHLRCLSCKNWEQCKCAVSGITDGIRSPARYISWQKGHCTIFGHKLAIILRVVYLTLQNISQLCRQQTALKSNAQLSCACL